MAQTVAINQMIVYDIGHGSIVILPQSSKYPPVRFCVQLANVIYLIVSIKVLGQSFGGQSYDLRLSKWQGRSLEDSKVTSVPDYPKQKLKNKEPCW